MSRSIVLGPVRRRSTGFRHVARSGAFGLALAACVGIGSPSVGVPEAEPAPGHAVYDTDLRPDLETGALEGRSTFRVHVGDSTPRRLGLLLNRGLQVSSVTGPAVRSYRVEASELAPVWNLIRVELAERGAPGVPITLEIRWAGRPEFPADSSNRITADFVELNLDSQWHPIVSTLDHTMTGRLRVALPSKWEVAASGAATFQDGAHVIRNHVPQVDVAFAAAPTFHATRSERFTALQRAGGGVAAGTILTAAERCAQYLNARFGSRDPLPRGTLVLAGRSGPGYARKNYIVLSQVDPGDSVAVHKFLCHELGHYWTRSAGSFSPHHWMTEAIPEYLAGRFLRERFGEAAFRAEVARWEEGGRAHGPVWTPESTRRPSYFLMYRRGPWLLSRLEERIGTELFERLMKRYMTEGVRTTPELLERLEAVAGRDAGNWFRAELANPPPRSN
jgi:hypothetical protein